MDKWELLLNQIELPTESQCTYIWGAGNTSRLAHLGMVRENLYEEFHVVGFLDKKTAGTNINGFEVAKPEILETMPSESIYVMISTAYYAIFHEISNILKKMRIKFCLLDAAILKARIDKVEEAINLFDSFSQRIYRHLLEKRITLEPVEQEFYAGEPYFGIRDFCRQRTNEFIIDCGAYVGDTMERFLWRLPLIKKIVCIEPDSGNYKALCSRIERLRNEWNCDEEKLIPLRAGIDKETSRRGMINSGDNLAAIPVQDSNGTDIEGIEFYAIDDLLNEYSWKSISYIKADIESYEYNMLLGAVKTIQRDRPRMALCIYHSGVDMFSIPLLVKKICPEYKMSVRHHSYDILETVLYAYI